ncbi:N-acetylneuraminate synthase family protein [Candidatus Pelagibacter sp.]|uniref:N-acetylneuraminate synthase family protein n=1 Tax=Candidatus Pelagibacter sp. TaxID=2024849 RepID=UPI003F82D562|tara:strand:+ start:1301 stop:2140 length:840 start_codon:yes stop_codon:yes gene_type:complete
MKRKKPLLIAEIGINHNGSLKLAKELILKAKDCGFDYVKFQKRDLNICIPEEVKYQERQSPWGRITYIEYKKKIEFTRKSYDLINNFCKKNKISFLCSAWDLNSLKFLKKYKFKINKIPSALITNLKFLDAVAKQKKKTLISTGMSTMRDISKAVKIFRKNKCNFVLMHCISEYPCPEYKLNLNMILTLKKKFKCEVGYSGHETSVSPSLFAWSLGADYIERHITLDRSMWGTDQAASLEEQGMRTLSNTLQKAPNLLGNGIKKFDSIEKKMLKKFKYW